VSTTETWFRNVLAPKASEEVLAEA
jgi:hypothetical protein